MAAILAKCKLMEKDGYGHYKQKYENFGNITKHSTVYKNKI